MIRLDLSKCQGFVHHRSGWNFCISQLKCLHSKSGILVDDFIERSVSWQVDSYYNGNNKYNLPHQREWIGFMHNPPNAPSWFDGYHSPQAILDREVFQESLKYCKCLITLSDYLKEWLQIRVNVPVISVKHPTEIPNQKWCAEAFSSQRPRPIVQLGYWLRKFHSIYKLKCGPLYKRMWLPSNYEYALCLQELFNKSNKQFKEKQFEFHGVEVCKFKPNKEYDALMCSCVVFVDLYDSSANNAIIECIARNTPILVNKIPPVVEYLGEDYPLYFENLKEASILLNNTNKIFEAFNYLKDMKKNYISGKSFARSLCSSLSRVL